jgi:hypothetical protein
MKIESCNLCGSGKECVQVGRIRVENNQNSKGFKEHPLQTIEECLERKNIEASKDFNGKWVDAAVPSPS